MHLTTLLEMAGEGFGDRVAFGSRADGLTYSGLLDRSRRLGVVAAARGVERLGLVDVNSDVVPTALFGAGFAGLPFVPMNYRLANDQLVRILERTAPSLVIVDDTVADRVGRLDGVELITRAEVLAEIEQISTDAAAPSSNGSPDDVAILLFTSGTTGDPKAAVLRHRHLASYVISTVDFMAADDDEAALVSVPPYHVAGASAVVTGVYAGRRVVYLANFTAEDWVSTVAAEAVTQAMVVPTMLGRVLDLLDASGERLPHLRHLSYGGGRMPVPVLERALAMLPHVDFVNAYGLTETSSTIAVLGPDDHRRAIGSGDSSARRRLGSVGRPLPTIELEIRGTDGTRLGPDEAGEIWVRGEQVAGEYLGRDDVMVDGWFPTNDAGSLDTEGYLYLEGRLDDVIVRGAENLSPGEIEDALVSHTAVADACVVGIPDVEWGEQVVAAIVLTAGRTATESELRDWVQQHLRSSKTPTHISFRPELPYNETGKLLRRVVKGELVEEFGS